MSAVRCQPTALTVYDKPPPGMFEALFKSLDADSAPVIGPAISRLLLIPLHDPQGAIIGGFWGSTQFSWLHIQMVILPEAMRGQKLGTALMHEAEQEAQARGCIGSYVDAFEFQAVGFYEKCGYRRFGALHDYPPGHTQVYLCKRFN